MNVSTLITGSARSSWKIALLAIVALAGFALATPAEAQQTAQTVIVLRGTGSQMTDRVQIGDRCTPGARALVHAKIEGRATGASVMATARCGPATAPVATCTATNTSTTRDNCNAPGGQPAGGLTADCAAAYLKSQTPAPDASWKVTCIFNL